MASHMAACYKEVDSYVGCRARLTSAETRLPVAPGPGNVEIVAESATGYTITAMSRASVDGVNHTFTISYAQVTGTDHDCGVRDKGGCPADGLW